MDRNTSHGSLYSDSDHPAELDNFPNGLESNGSREFLNPSRPSSRLGFNRTILSPISPEVPADSEAIQWSHSLFQNVGISDLRLSSIKPHSQAKEDTMNPVSTGESVVERGDNPLTSTDSSPSNVAYDRVSDNLSRSPVVSRKSPKTSPPPVSRLCFPFVTTPSPRRKRTSPSPPPPPPPPPPTRHKYSCFPSLMSPSSPGRPFPKHQRHNYRQHGYSRLALQQVKWFWSTRAEEWEGYNMYRHEAPSHEGIPPIGHNFLPTIHPSSSNALTEQANALPQTLPPISVHPRRGDITALRDPYAMHIDRAFVDIPTWTIGKALWMSELHVATDNRTGSRNVSEEDNSDCDSDNELEMSASIGFSDDSDATLVESESETDLPNLYVSKPVTKVQEESDITTTSDIGSSSTMATQQTSHNLSGERNISENRNWLQSVISVIYKPPSSSSRARKRKWATNWYQRWELLVKLSRRDKDRRYTSFEAEAPSLVMRPLVNNTHRFFLGDKSTEPDDDPWSARLEDIDPRRGPPFANASCSDL